MKQYWILRKYYIRRFRESVLTWLAWKMPKSLVMWASMRLIAHATTNEYSSTIVPDLTAMEAIRRWDS